MSRTLTAYKRPPIAEVFGQCGSIQALGRVRSGLAYGAFQGTIHPSEKTERSWERAFWTRVIELILSADGVTVCPTFIYNHQLRWKRPPHIAAAVDAAFEAQYRSLPSPAERMRAHGIVIEGIK
jgi:hypothetical protein